MKINKLDLLRLVRVVKSTGLNEVKIDEAGKFGTVSADGGMFLFGKGISLGKKVGFLDLTVLQSMLNAIPTNDIVIDFQEPKMVITGSNLIFGYRLGSTDLIAGYGEDKLAEFEKGDWATGTFMFEELSNIKNLARALSINKIGFEEVEGSLNVNIGDKQLFYGEVKLMGVKLDKKVEFLAPKITAIFDVLDENRITLSFMKGEKKIMKIATKDFVWIVGGLIE